MLSVESIMFCQNFFFLSTMTVISIYCALEGQVSVHDNNTIQVSSFTSFTSNLKKKLSPQKFLVLEIGLYHSLADVTDEPEAIKFKKTVQENKKDKKRLRRNCVLRYGNEMQRKSSFLLEIRHIMK